MSQSLDSSTSSIDGSIDESLHETVQETVKPPTPPTLPPLSILPYPQPAGALPTGQLVSRSGTHNPTTLEDRDYDDAGVRWYKDVILIDNKTGKFKDSLGGVLYIPKPDVGTDVGTIEAHDMRVRMLKDPKAGLAKVLRDGNARRWVLEQAGKGEGVGFVTAVREVENASYKHAGVADRGAGNWEVVRKVAGEDREGRRRDSGLAIETGSKRDAVGVVVRHVVVDGEEIALGAEMGTEFWG